MFWPSPEETMCCQECEVYPVRQFAERSFYVQRELKNIESDQPIDHESASHTVFAVGQEVAPDHPPSYLAGDDLHNASQNGTDVLMLSHREAWLRLWEAPC